ncbi:hypothetical protein D3C84_1149630 [compost metagenome]
MLRLAHIFEPVSHWNPLALLLRVVRNIRDALLHLVHGEEACIDSLIDQRLPDLLLRQPVERTRDQNLAID